MRSDTVENGDSLVKVVNESAQNKEISPGNYFAGH